MQSLLWGAEGGCGFLATCLQLSGRGAGEQGCYLARCSLGWWWGAWVEGTAPCSCFVPVHTAWCARNAKWWARNPRDQQDLLHWASCWMTSLFMNWFLGRDKEMEICSHAVFSPGLYLQAGCSIRPALTWFPFHLLTTVHSGFFFSLRFHLLQLESSEFRCSISFSWLSPSG